jgi:hypothetical protein
MSAKTRILTVFERKFTTGILAGLTHKDKIIHIDRWHAAHWIKGIRRNSNNGILEYKLSSVKNIVIPNMVRGKNVLIERSYSLDVL